MKKIIIAAIAKNGVIGRNNGELPWHIKEEFQHFKQTTLGFPIIMGRKTFDSLRNPLKHRFNIVITRKVNLENDVDDLVFLDSINKAVAFAETLGKEKVFIIGGGDIYRQSLLIADEMILSFLNFDAEGEIFFPEFNKDEWEVVSEEKRELFSIVTFRKI